MMQRELLSRGRVPVKLENGSWINAPLPNATLTTTATHERDNNVDRSIKVSKAALHSNETLMRHAAALNEWDVRLYALAVQRFCAGIKERHPDLDARLRSKNSTLCGG